MAMADFFSVEFMRDILAAHNTTNRLLKPPLFHPKRNDFIPQLKVQEHCSFLYNSDQQNNTDVSMENPIKNIDDVMTLTQADMEKVNSHLKSQLNSDVVLINQIAAYIINNGGKRLRPVLHVLLAQALGYQGDEHINLAAVIELIHTATLLHDDVVDESEMRRGEKTSHEIWGNSASVLVGDFLYSKSFQMMVKADSMRVMKILSDATNKISEGEVQQLLNIGNLEISEADYFQIIANKTAKLFEAACELAGVIAGKGDETIKELGQFGMFLGTAFQIADDVLDYTADDESLGKNLGDDFNEGKLTLPLIFLLKNGTQAQQQTISQAIEHPELADFEAIKNMVIQTEAIEYTLGQAQNYSNKAKRSLNVINDSKAKSGLEFVCDYAWKRTV